MNVTYARALRRVFGTKTVQVFVKEESLFDDDEVVRVKNTRTGVRVWALWCNPPRNEEEKTIWEVGEWYFPVCDEVRIFK